MRELEAKIEVNFVHLKHSRSSLCFASPSGRTNDIIGALQLDHNTTIQSGDTTPIQKFTGRIPCDRGFRPAYVSDEVLV